MSSQIRSLQIKVQISKIKSTLTIRHRIATLDSKSPDSFELKYFKDYAAAF